MWKAWSNCWNQLVRLVVNSHPVPCAIGCLNLNLNHRARIDHPRFWPEFSRAISALPILFSSRTPSICPYAPFLSYPFSLCFPASNLFFQFCHRQWYVEELENPTKAKMSNQTRKKILKMAQTWNHHRCIIQRPATQEYSRCLEQLACSLTRWWIQAQPAHNHAPTPNEFIACLSATYQQAVNNFARNEFCPRHFGGVRATPKKFDIPHWPPRTQAWQQENPIISTKEPIAGNLRNLKRKGTTSNRQQIISKYQTNMLRTRLCTEGNPDNNIQWQDYILPNCLIFKIFKCSVHRTETRVSKTHKITYLVLHQTLARSQIKIRMGWKS